MFDNIQTKKVVIARSFTPSSVACEGKLPKKNNEPPA